MQFSISKHFIAVNDNQQFIYHVFHINISACSRKSCTFFLSEHIFSTLYCGRRKTAEKKKSPRHIYVVCVRSFFLRVKFLKLITLNRNYTLLFWPITNRNSQWYTFTCPKHQNQELNVTGSCIAWNKKSSDICIANEFVKMCGSFNISNGFSCMCLRLWRYFKIVFFLFVFSEMNAHFTWRKNIIGKADPKCVYFMLHTWIQIKTNIAKWMYTKILKSEKREKERERGRDR